MPALGIHVESFTGKNVECLVPLRNPGDGARNHHHPADPSAGWRLTKPGGENADRWMYPIVGLFFVPAHTHARAHAHTQRKRVTTEEESLKHAPSEVPRG